MLLPLLAAAALAAAELSASALPASALPVDARCSIARPEGGRWTPDLENTRSLVRQADVIVRARAVGGDSAAAPRHTSVMLQVLEVLHGDTVPEQLSVYGWLTAEDDFNPDPAPYVWVRREGQRGMCFALGYRRGGEFLLLLRRADEERRLFAAEPGQLTPYWAALSPTNEQLRGADDPWLAWVRAELRRARPQ